MTNKQAHAIFGCHIANRRAIHLPLTAGRSIHDTIQDEHLHVVSDHNGLLECEAVATKVHDMGPYHLTWLVAYDGRAVRVRAEDVTD
jgi:hypothetical protein